MNLGKTFAAEQLDSGRIIKYKRCTTVGSYTRVGSNDNNNNNNNYGYYYYYVVFS
jgi:hypothetical protein